HTVDSWSILWSSHELHHYIVVEVGNHSEVSHISAILCIVEMMADSLERNGIPIHSLETPELELK
ncbi:hypothetical protein PMAYCL1PPCAC_25491, partial [Pristionchus mayeri]